MNKTPKEIVSEELDSVQKDYQVLSELLNKYNVSNKEYVLDNLEAVIDKLKYILTRI
jgi:hypothetical protein